MMNRLFRKIFWSTFGFLVISIGIFIYGKYLHTVSEGYRTGLIQKITPKGNIFKTYEGEMIVHSKKGNPNVENAAEKFYFSVTAKNMVDKLDTIQGKIVVVHYRQKNGAIFWHGDSPFLVDTIKPKP